MNSCVQCSSTQPYIHHTLTRLTASYARVTRILFDSGLSTINWVEPRYCKSRAEKSRHRHTCTIHEEQTCPSHPRQQRLCQAHAQDIMADHVHTYFRPSYKQCFAKSVFNWQGTVPKQCLETQMQAANKNSSNRVSHKQNKRGLDVLVRRKQRLSMNVEHLHKQEKHTLTEKDFPRWIGANSFGSYRRRTSKTKAEPLNTNSTDLCFVLRIFLQLLHYDWDQIAEQISRYTLQSKYFSACNVRLCCNRHEMDTHIDGFSKFMTSIQPRSMASQK